MAIPPIRLCRELTIDLPTEIKSLNRNGTLLRIAAVVSAIALVVLFSIASAIYLGLLTLPPAAIIGGLVAGAIAVRGTDCFKEGRDLYYESANLKRISDKIDLISGKIADIPGWDEDQIVAYCTANGITDQQINQNEAIWTRLNPERPAHALLPLIARELILTEQDAALRDSANINFNAMRNFKAVPQLVVDYAKKALEDREGVAATIFGRAMLLQNLIHPNHQFIESDNVLIVISEDEIQTSLGKFAIKTPEIRTLQYMRIPGQQELPPPIYFRSLPFGAATISIDQLCADNLQPRDVRTLIFG